MKLLFHQKNDIVCLLFFRHEILRQELIRTISNVIKLQLNTLGVYHYIIRILKD